MAPYEVIRFHGSTDEVNRQWHEQRSKGIGGSDVAALMGLSPYKAPYALWTEKVGLTEPEDISGKPAVIVGNVMEDTLRKWFRSRHPELVVTALNGILQSRERPWAQASLDGVCHVRGAKKSDESSYAVLECKTVGEWRVKDWYDEDGNLRVPVYYECQVAQYLSVTGWPRAYVVALFGNREFVEVEVTRDEDDVRAVNEAVDRFWKVNVEGNVAPDITGAACDSAALLASTPQSGNECPYVVESEAAERFLAAKASRDAAEGRYREAANLLKQEIGSRAGIETADGRFAWQRGTSQRFDAKEFDRDHPGMRDKYMTTAARDGGIRFTPRKE